MRLRDMPVVTVEQVVRFRDAALEIERKRSPWRTDFRLPGTPRF
jgi:hypothetical protein